MHKITNLWKFELNWSSKLPENNGKKKSLSLGLEINSNILVWNYFFLENNFTSDGAVYHNVLHYQPLPITSYQVRFYANNGFG